MAAAQNTDEAAGTIEAAAAPITVRAAVAVSAVAAPAAPTAAALDEKTEEAAVAN